MIEQKGLGFEPEYERTIITDGLQDLFKFNTDLEIVSYKKWKKFLILIDKPHDTHFFRQIKTL